MTDDKIFVLAGKYRIDHYGDYDRNSSEHTRDLLLFARAIEQAARREALEAAMQSADMARSKFSASGHIQQTAGAWCAHEEIRALMGDEG